MHVEMADLHADHEIVTKFLLDTCSLRQFVNESAVRALLDCAEIEIDEGWHNLVTTGILH